MFLMIVLMLNLSLEVKVVTLRKLPLLLNSCIFLTSAIKLGDQLLLTVEENVVRSRKMFNIEHT